MSKHIYRIVPQVIGEEPAEDAMSDEMKVGFECDGFVIIGFDQRRQSFALHRCLMTDIAKAIAGSETLLKAARLALFLDLLEKGPKSPFGEKPQEKNQELQGKEFDTIREEIVT